MNSSNNQYHTPLIDREIFFGNPVIAGAQLSPNGEYITFIKPLEGIMNIWIKGINDAFDTAIPLTQDKTRPIRSYFWSRDSRYVLYVQDKGGDENFRVYRIDPKEATDKHIPKAIDLTPYDDIRAMIVSLPKKSEDKIYIGINDRDKAWHDYYSVDIGNGNKTLILENTEHLNGVTFDLQGELRLASRSLADGGNEILKLTKNGWESILKSNLEESISPIKFTKEGDLYIISNVGDPDLMGLYLYNMESGDTVLIESDPENQVDIQNASFSQETEELIATIYVGDKKRIYWRDESYKQDYEYLKEQYPGAEISITSSTKDENLWLFYVNKDTDPGNAYSYERSSKVITHLYTPRPDLPTEHLTNMTPVSYPSSDGMIIPAYLTLPNTQSTENLPAVVFVHGGPWARDHWGYNSFAQFLANRGYVVIQPNFRGSTGYGKKFLNAAINEWGEKMQDDLTAAAQYLTEKKYADPKRIAIMGGSYGGYATLAGLTFTPDVYAAGVSIVGPSNLFTLLETIPPYWESARVMFHKRMGNPNTEEGRAQLTRQSPFFHAKNINAPLLVAQGNNDPRVKTSESDQIVIAMRDIDLPVEYLNFPDEGHGFANPRNNMAFIAVMEKFLADHIGGRYQESVPDNLAKIIVNVTVDIASLEMPKSISDSERSASLPIPEKKILTGQYVYDLSLDMQGKKMGFEVTRTVFVADDTLTITDNSVSPGGDMTDICKVQLSDFTPIDREFSQGPMSINYSVNNQTINGQVIMNDDAKDFEIKPENTFVMDGPALDCYLSALPLTSSYQKVIRLYNTQGQSIQTYNFSVVGEDTIDLYECYRCQLQSLDGPDKKQTLWLSKSDNPLLVKKSSIIAEMGGAQMDMQLRHIEN